MASLDEHWNASRRNVGALSRKLKAACAERDFKRERARALEERLREQVAALETLRSEHEAGCSASVQRPRSVPRTRRPLHTAPRSSDRLTQRTSVVKPSRDGCTAGGGANVGSVVGRSEEENVIHGAEHRRSASGTGSVTRAAAAPGLGGGDAARKDEQLAPKEERRLLERHLDALDRA